MEAQAQLSERKIDNAKTQEEAVQFAAEAADWYMKALKLASSPTERARLKTACFRVLDRGKEIKQLQTWPPPLKQLVMPKSTRTLSTREKIIVLASSKVNGAKFPPWDEDPDPETFDLAPGEPAYLDDVDMGLSKIQLDAFSGWKRPAAALRKVIDADKKSFASVEPTMHATKKVDLVQDITADCSVVASLCSAASRGEDGYVRLLGSIIYPYDHGLRRPILTKSGRYMFKFQFNGCFRQVVVDDRLPASKTSRTLFVTDRNNPGLLWPALAEKAYLKLRGGYDFPGSNSGTDLWVLTGWIPEQIFLQSDEIRPQDLWKRVLQAFDFGDVMLTLGTGRLSQKEEEGLGLAGEHDYAVLSMRESHGQRMMLVKNPWCDGMVWKDTTHIPSETTEQWAAELKDALPEVENRLQGTFWIPYDHVIRNFESMYLNWNPGLFLYRQDHHFRWEITPQTTPDCFTHNPQYSITCRKGGVVWVLLSKHFTTEECEMSKHIAAGTAPSSSVGFISLYSFDAAGHKVHVSDNPLSRGPFVDSPQTLARLDMPTDAQHTIVPAQQDLPLPTYSFTLSVFSRMPVEVCIAEDPFPHQRKITSAWTYQTAGGNASSPSYDINPQFRINIPALASVTLLLESDVSELPIHVKIVWSRGERVTSVIAQDIVAESGEYRRGFTFANIKTIMAGSYTIVCSTFEAGQLGKFTLSVLSTELCELAPVPAENAGMFSTRLPILVMPPGTDRILAPLTVSRLTMVKVIVRYATVKIEGRQLNRSKTPIRTSLEQGQGPNKEIRAESSSEDVYGEANTGCRTGHVHLTPEACVQGRGGVWLSVERLPGTQVIEVFEVEVLSDLKVMVGSWGTGSG